MRYLLTGVSGFLGGVVGRAAAAAGHEVIALGRSAYPPTGWPDEYRAVDFGAPVAVGRVVAAANPDAVLHFAGSASVGASLGDPLRDFEDSTVLWFRLLEAIRLSGRRPLVAFASSAAVYGSPEILPTPETAPRRPESPYGFHKLLSEQAGEEFARCFDLSVVSLRFFSVFGPSQRRLLVSEIFEQLRAGASKLRLKGTGEERRDFLAEDEAATAVLALIDGLASAAREPGWRAVNLASGASVSVRDVAESLREGTGSAAKIIFGGDDSPGNPARWQADISELRRLAPGWSPRPFAKSLAKFLSAWDDFSPTAASRRPAFRP